MSASVCPECGLDCDTIAPSDAKVAIRSFPRRYRSIVQAVRLEEGGDDLLRFRPDVTTWSALEYTAHVADLFDDFARILRRTRLEDRPSISVPDAEERAVAEHYNEREIDAALAHLEEASLHLAAELDNASGAKTSSPPSAWP